MENTSDNQEKKKNKVLPWIIVIVLLLIIGGLLYVILNSNGSENEGWSYKREVKARLGQLEGKSEAEIQAELNRVIKEGMFHIVINSDPVFENGTSEGNLEIENVPNNHYLMRVEITLDDTGEVVYSTDYIDPNMYVQRASLSVELPKGDYAATAIFYAYDTSTLVQMGSVGSKMTLHILN